MIDYENLVLNLIRKMGQANIYGFFVKTELNPMRTTIGLVRTVNEFLRCKAEERKYDECMFSATLYETYTCANLLRKLDVKSDGERRRLIDIISHVIEMM